MPQKTLTIQKLLGSNFATALARKTGLTNQDAAELIHKVITMANRGPQRRPKMATESSKLDPKSAKRRRELPARPKVASVQVGGKTYKVSLPDPGKAVVQYASLGKLQKLAFHAPAKLTGFKALEFSPNLENRFDQDIKVKVFEAGDILDIYFDMLEGDPDVDRPKKVKPSTKGLLKGNSPSQEADSGNR